MKQLTFNNKKSYDDLGIILESYTINPPSKKKIKESVPFMNGSYDFSTVGSNGEIVYTERDIQVNFNLHARSKSELYNKYSEALEWALGVGQASLIFEDSPDVYWLAEVEEAPSFEEVLSRNGKLQIRFVAEPFKIGTEVEGDKIWDTFNFETDYLQETEFEVNGILVTTIYNPGRTVVPQVNTSVPMSITANGYTLTTISGSNKDYRFKFKNGANTVTINGSGTVKIFFRKELL